MSLKRIGELLAKLESELGTESSKSLASEIRRELDIFRGELRDQTSSLIGEIAAEQGASTVALRLTEFCDKLLMSDAATLLTTSSDKLLYSWKELASQEMGAMFALDGKVSNLPKWGLAGFADAAGIIGAPRFPCIFGRRSAITRAGWTCFVDTVEDPADQDIVRRAILQYFEHIDQLPEEVAVLQPLQVLVKPVTPALSAAEYSRQAWGLFQFLHDHDEVPWPSHVPTDTENGHWSFCFAGREFFSNVSHPGHRVTTSRNVGICLAFAMQPRKNFDFVAGDNPAGRQIRERIRSRVEEYEGRPIAAELIGFHGNENSREWMQMIRQEGDEPYPSRCPLQIKRK